MTCEGITDDFVIERNGEHYCRVCNAPKDADDHDAQLCEDTYSL